MVCQIRTHTGLPKKKPRKLPNQIDTLFGVTSFIGPCITNPISHCPLINIKEIF